MLQTKYILHLGELEYKLAFEYDAIYESKRSYYDLFGAAGISWKKTSALNPKADKETVAAKKPILLHCWQVRDEEIKSGKLRVLSIDECRLFWGDLTRYVWGKTDK